MRDAEGHFVAGYAADNRLPIGSIRVRTRRNRTPPQRVFVKVAEPNRWMLRAHRTWETTHGSIPRGMCIHHKNGNALDDALANLKLVSRAQHLTHHSPKYDHAKRIAHSTKARRERRWSTKSKTKRTGRHPQGCDCPLHRKHPS